MTQEIMSTEHRKLFMEEIARIVLSSWQYDMNATIRRKSNPDIIIRFREYFEAWFDDEYGTEYMGYGEDECVKS